MRRFAIIPPLAFVIIGQLSLFAVERHYEKGKIVDVQQKTNTRILYYVVNTPITKDEPYYEVSVQLKDTIYLGRYTPRHADETLPEEWVAGAPVDARIAGRHLFLQCPSGAEINFVMVKHTVVKAEQNSPASTPAKQ